MERRWVPWLLVSVRWCEGPCGLDLSQETQCPSQDDRMNSASQSPRAIRQASRTSGSGPTGGSETDLPRSWSLRWSKWPRNHHQRRRSVCRCEDRRPRGESGESRRRTHRAFPHDFGPCWPVGKPVQGRQVYCTRD